MPPRNPPRRLMVVKQLVVLAFVDEHRAAEVLAMLQRIHTGHVFQYDNAVCVVRATDWNVKLTHGMDLGRLDDKPRQFWRALIATLVLAPGTADCRRTGQDFGIEPGFERELHANLPLASSAVFMIVSPQMLSDIVEDLHRCGGTLLRSNLAMCNCDEKSSFWSEGLPGLATGY
jgi:uncharacterized membrane protein